MRKVVFLDVDGVLNSARTTTLVDGYMGVDERNVRRLAQLIRYSGAEIVLSSSWKSFWDKEMQHCDPFGHESMDRLPAMAKGLVESLHKYGLQLSDRTFDQGINRGMGIREWLDCNKDVKRFVVIDDEQFPDFSCCDLLPQFVHTDFRWGLTYWNVVQALGILRRDPHLSEKWRHYDLEDIKKEYRHRGYKL